MAILGRRNIMCSCTDIKKIGHSGIMRSTGVRECERRVVAGADWINVNNS